jgi:hypothetical protein
MAVYLVAYDLRKPGQNYDRLIQALQSVPYCRPLESTWFIEVTGNARAVRDWLKAFIDQNDRMIVSEMTPDWAMYNPKNDCGKFLEARGL